MTNTELFQSGVTVDEYSVYKCTIDISHSSKYIALRLVGKNDNGEEILKRDLKSDGEITSIFFTNENKEHLELEIKSKCGKRICVEDVVNLFSIEKIGDTRKSICFETDQNSISVAIATYPARRKSLIETVDSLICQVDYLLLYLNDYQEIPEEIQKHKYRNKIICVIDEAGQRRAEGKFHWMHRVNGYYLTCDDDIIYPEDYVERLVAAIDENSRQKVVGLHGMVFHDFIASFKADRKEFYRFSEEVTEDKACHLLGTGVCGFHASLFESVSSALLTKYPYAVDPAFSVICKNNKIPMLCLKHEKEWLKSSPHMLYGLHEEKQSCNDKNKSVNELLSSNNPWGNGSGLNILSCFKKNKKLRKFCRNPRKFFQDSYIGKFF